APPARPDSYRYIGVELEKHPSSEASSLYCTLATMREHHSQAYVGLFKTPWAEKSLCELLDTHLENVQLALSQRDACDGVIQESIACQREFCDRCDERRGEFKDHCMTCFSGLTAQTYCADKIKAQCRSASGLRAIP